MDNKETMFFGALSMYGKNTISTDITATAATNGIDTAYNPDFVQELDNKELLFIVLHEQMHKAYKHLSTWKHLVKEDALLANMAMDYVINLKLVDLDPQGRLFTMPTFKEGEKKGQPQGLIDEAYRDMDTQQVFNDLKQKNKQPTQPPTNEGGKPCPDDYSEEIKERMKHHLDDHNWDEKASDEEIEKTEVELDRAIRQCIEAVGDGAGDFVTQLKADIEVVTPWEELLADFIQSVCKGSDISSFRRYNKRLIGSDILMPHTLGEQIGEVVVAIDTSASVGQETIDQFLSEVKVIVEDVLPEKVHLMYWDTAVASHEIYDENDYDVLTETIKPMGGGGTDPLCVAEYVEDNILLESKVEAVIFLNPTPAYCLINSANAGLSVVTIPPSPHDKCFEFSKLQLPTSPAVPAILPL
jgi:predicted metal-dependent peptidase